jgi:Zn-dependent M28 family amino/carboxypeptidase
LKLLPTAWPLLVLALTACAERPEPVVEEDAPLEGLEPTLARITAADLRAHIDVLAHDSLEGRAPATPGEERTVRYLTERFQAFGLEPGNPDGTFVQNVPMVGITSNVGASLRLGGEPVTLTGPTDYIASTLRAEPEVRVADSELVFVGYGVVAPEFGWDDFKGVDVRGKTIVMLVNDPPIPSAADSTVLDTTLFRGRAMTLYGRWTYKYQVAAEKGAAAALIIHETGPAGYPFEVLSAGWGRETFDVRAPLGSTPPVPVQGWLTEPAARRVLGAAGQDFDQLKAAARSRDFRPVPLNGTASFTIRNQLREVQSKNVIAKLTGSELPDEYIIYTAHWDHLGRDTTRAGDQVFNGALDNATGTAALLEIAKAFAQNQPRPKRSILFLAVTAEEKGLLGAKYYAENPLYPLTKTLANINMDGMNQWGRTSDLGVIGLGNSTLDDVLLKAVTPRGRTLTPDAEPEKGFYYRSDHFEFAKQGVPALYIKGGMQYIGKPTDFGKQKREEYTANDYHKPSDEVKPDWDLSGAVEDAQMLFEVGFRVAQASKWPEWKPGTEFKAKREAMLQKQ